MWLIQTNKAVLVGSLMIGMTSHRAPKLYSDGSQSSGASAGGARYGGAVIRDRGPKVLSGGCPSRRVAPERPVRPHLAEPSLAITFKFLKAQS